MWKKLNKRSIKRWAQLDANVARFVAEHPDACFEQEPYGRVRATCGSRIYDVIDTGRLISTCDGWPVTASEFQLQSSL